jgi:hypothetical protein
MPSRLSILFALSRVVLRLIQTWYGYTKGYNRSPRTKRAD